MGRLTTHILDTELGRPAAGVTVEAFRISGEDGGKVGETVTNSDGRTDGPILEGGAFAAGTYELRFLCGPYLAATRPPSAQPGFLETVVIRFGVASGDEHYHVPLLLQSHGYSTYRGS